MKVNNKKHVIEQEVCSYQFEDPNPDMTVYGWVIEIKMKNTDFWTTYWTNKIYSSKSSAENAIIQIPKMVGEEYRIVPLYRLQGYALRDFKIKEILGEVKVKKPHDLKAWKSLDDFSYHGSEYKKGSVFIQLENGTIVRSGQNEKTNRLWLNDFKIKLKDEQLFKEIELKDEKWLRPHLLKEVKVLLKKQEEDGKI
jgi:hypothetical protein